MGQCLWIEDMHPATKLLDAFVEFLVWGSSDFVYKPQAEPLAIADFDARADRAEFRREKERHVRIDAGQRLDRALEAGKVA